MVDGRALLGDCDMTPSSDTSEAVQIEIRAAELAAGFTKTRSRLGDRGRWTGRHYLEWLGGSCHSQGIGTLPHLPCQAGYLARAIVFHESETE